MQVKFILQSADATHEVTPDSLKNWADVTCSYSRSAIRGVVRKFISSFEFVAEARDFLLGLFLESGVESQCEVTMLTLTDSWDWAPEFSCPLDFSTVEWDDYTFKISAVDNSLSAMLKADKSTKYEMVVGDGITPDYTFRFDRIPMMESVTYKFTQGTSDPATGALSVTQYAGDMPWLGLVADEICINKAIHYNDDQESEGGYILSAQNDCDVTLEWMVDYDDSKGGGSQQGYQIEVFSGASVKATHVLTDAGGGGQLWLGGPSRYQSVGTFSSYDQLPEATGSGSEILYWANVSGIAWESKYNGHGYYWYCSGKTPQEYFSRKKSGTIALSLSVGDCVRLRTPWPDSAENSQFTVNDSSFVLSWRGRGDPCNIEAFSPTTVAEAIVTRIAADRISAEVEISDYDPRMAKTALMAAESIRGIAGAKLYASFSDFSDWMEAVYGYVYTVEEESGVVELPPYVSLGMCLDEIPKVKGTKYTGDLTLSCIYYVKQYGRFFYYYEGEYYAGFDGYNVFAEGSKIEPKAGVYYKFLNTGIVYFDKADGVLDPEPKPYVYSVSLEGKPKAKVRFLHRSELFSPTVGKSIESADELSVKIDSSLIYSTVTVGYDKKDYGSVNGRDEFNFSATYTTGSAVSDKKLTLQSKYRADSYGVEFAAQKRGEDTTDTTSDQDVFFVCCNIVGTDATADRSPSVTGTITDQVFNAQFTPKACALANASYIGIQGSALTLSFASATGNSDVTVDSDAVNTDITLDNPLMTCATVEFATDDLEVPTNMGAVVEVDSCGIRYTGYVADLDLNYSREEAAKYKLLVKSIEKQW